MAGVLLIFLPRVFVKDSHWFTIPHFCLEYPEKAWLPKIYKLLVLSWILFSLVFTFNYFQGIALDALLFLAIFVPFLGIGVIKGVMEAGFGTSVYIGVRRAARGEVGVIWFRVVFFSIRFVFEYYFALDKERFQRIGILRALVNLMLLISLIFLPL